MTSNVDASSAVTTDPSSPPVALVVSSPATETNNVRPSGLIHAEVRPIDPTLGRSSSDVLTLSDLVFIAATSPRPASTMYRYDPSGVVAIACSSAGRSHIALGSPTQCAHPSSRLSTWTNDTFASFATGASCGAYPGRELVYRVYSWLASGARSCDRRVPGIRSAGPLNGPKTGRSFSRTRSSTVTRYAVGVSAGKCWIRNRLRSSVENASGSKLPSRSSVIVSFTPVGSATTIVVRARGNGIDGSQPSGSGSVRATARPLSETMRASSSPGTVIVDSSKPVAASRLSIAVSRPSDDVDITHPPPRLDTAPGPSNTTEPVGTRTTRGPSGVPRKSVSAGEVLALVVSVGVIEPVHAAISSVSTDAVTSSLTRIAASRLVVRHWSPNASTRTTAGTPRRFQGTDARSARSASMRKRTRTAKRGDRDAA